MKFNCHTKSTGKCKSCGKEGKQFRIEKKGKRKGGKFLDNSAYCKVFEEVNYFRGDDEYIGTFCRECFKNKKYLIQSN